MDTINHRSTSQDSNLPAQDALIDRSLYQSADKIITLIAVFAFPVLHAIEILLKDHQIVADPSWLSQILLPGICIFSGIFFAFDFFLNLKYQGKSYLRSPFAWINMLAILSMGGSLISQSLTAINPRILRLLHTFRAITRLTLMHKSILEDGVLGHEAIARLNEDDVRFTLIILILISALLGAVVPTDGNITLLDCLHLTLLYFGFLFLSHWKTRRNVYHIEEVFSKRLAEANNTLYKRMARIPGLTNPEAWLKKKVEQTQKETGEPLNEVTVMVESLDDIIHTLRRFISRRAFEEARGETVLPEKADVAMIFTDIASFSTATEQMQQKIIPVLKYYFSQLHQGVTQFSGDIDKFIGDAMFIWYYNADNPKQTANHAFQSALLMHNLGLEMPEKHEQWLELFKEHPDWQRFREMRTRFGLHIGPVISGAIGSKKRADSTLIGDNVNITARLEAMNKKYGTEILMSQPFYDQLDSELQKKCRRLDYIAVAGRENPLFIYTVIDDPQNEKLESRYQEALTYYLKGEWHQAYQRFEQALQENPNDGPTKAMMKRIREVNNYWPTLKGYLSALPEEMIPDSTHRFVEEKTTQQTFQAPDYWQEKPWWSHTK
ncbi:adenylate/guanylate cyclase domain-containing protein [Magnetococcales bacterium HHB-1]